MSKNKKIILVSLSAILAAACVWGWRSYSEFSSVPKTRLQPGAHYPEMPADDRHRYIALPVNHDDSSQGSFTGFYILSPNFRRKAPVIFVLTDGQQERVHPGADINWFEDRLRGLSYVLIGHRGHAPTLFPEVYGADGAPDYKSALSLYGSAQQVEDIEGVRRDMLRLGYLPADAKIMLYGGSGGGFLIQQYLHKYGRNVTRVLIESSGAPDLALRHHASFFKNYARHNKNAAQLLDKLPPGRRSAALCYMLFKMAQERPDAPELQTAVLQGAAGNSVSGKWLYWKHWANPNYNWWLVKSLMGLPLELAVKVRMYELLGASLAAYDSGNGVEPMYEWCGAVLADFIKAQKAGEIAPPEFLLDRSGFNGEVLVWSGTRDHVFSQEMAGWLAGAYRNSRLATFDEGHRTMSNPRYYLEFRQAFFAKGLYSPQVDKYFKDSRQLLKKGPVSRFSGI